MKKVVIAALVALMANTACWPFDSGQPLADMTIRREKGTVTVQRAAETLTVEDELAIEPGDVISTTPDSLAEFALKDDRIVLIGGQDASSVEVVDESSLESLTGSLVASVKRPTEVMFGEITVKASESVFRIDKGYSTRTGVYSGEVRLSTLGEQDVVLGRLYESVAVRNSGLGNADPYSLAVQDPWDRVFAKEAVEMESQLGPLADGFKGQLQGERPGLNYFSVLGEDLAGSSDVSFMRPFLKTPPVDLLLGFNVATQIDGMNLEKAFERAMELFEDGGSWGVIAAILHAKPRPLIAQIEKVIDATNAVAQNGQSGDAFTLSAAEGATGPVTQDPNPIDDPTDPDPRDDDPDPPDPDPDPDPDPEEPEEPEDCANWAECQVNDITNPGGGGGGGDPEPDPTPSVLDL